MLSSIHIFPQNQNSLFAILSTPLPPNSLSRVFINLQVSMVSAILLICLLYNSAPGADWCSRRFVMLFISDLRLLLGHSQKGWILWIWLTAGGDKISLRESFDLEVRYRFVNSRQRGLYSWWCMQIYVSKSKNKLKNKNWIYEKVTKKKWGFAAVTLVLTLQLIRK